VHHEIGTIFEVYAADFLKHKDTFEFQHFLGGGEVQIS